MRANELLDHPAIGELAKRLPSLEKHDYNEIDKLMRQVAMKHRIHRKALEKLFARKYKRHPHDFTDGIDEDGGATDESDRQQQIRDFIEWCYPVLHLDKPYPQITLSKDTEEAQSGHHTGLNVPDENTIWVYIGNRNLVDCFRTIAHELTHTKQNQLGRIGPNDSYPGSNIEMVADSIAGILIKLYAKKHPEVIE